jgi:DNA transformation protein
MSEQRRSLHLLPGLGTMTSGWLAEVGIVTEDDLRAIGAPAAYRRLKHLNPKGINLNALWGLHSALTGVPWNRIDAETKARLLSEVGVSSFQGISRARPSRRS